MRQFYLSLFVSSITVCYCNKLRGDARPKPSSQYYDDDNNDIDIYRPTRPQSKGRRRDFTNEFLEELQDVENETSVVLENRRLEDDNEYYWETTSLGFLNYDATLGNPLRGLSGLPQATDPSMWPESIPGSLHHYKFPLNEVMRGDPDVVGVNSAFNWSIVDDALTTAARFRSHTVLRFFIHYPGLPLALPQHLVGHVQTLWNGQEVVPWYGDEKLRHAMNQFISHFGQRYDGDTRIYTIQAGLIGYWGEMHTGDCTFNWEPCDPEFVHQEVVQWYGESFKNTIIQVRYPKRQDAYNLGMGYHDDSFTYETVSGPANGYTGSKHFFYNMSVYSNTSDAWRHAIIGGEVRPENQNVFEDYYPAGASYHQDFMFCAKITHASYMDWSRGFNKNGVTDGELNRARYAHARLGYAFQLTKVGAAPAADPTKVDIDATIKQIGIAPFYYPLFLDVFCDGSKVASKWIFAKDLTDPGDATVINLRDIPATYACLSEIEFRLGSTWAYSDRPIRWAQGIDGKVILDIPLPPGVVETRTDPKIEPKLTVRFPEPPVEGAVGRCFLVCADTYCPDGRKMGQDLRGIQDEAIVPVYTVGNELSMRCDVNDPRTNKVLFRWPGYRHIETFFPWALNGNIGTTFFPLDYFTYPGRKTVYIAAYNDFTWLGDRVIDFKLVDA